MNKPSFDRFTGDYRNHLERGSYKLLGGEAHEYYIYAKVRELLDLTDNLSAPPGAVVDVGCGIGLTEKFLSPHFSSLTGCDISIEMLRQAQDGKPDNCTFLQSSGLFLPFKQGSVGILFSFSLFHHVPRERHGEMMREMSRILRPGGLLVICEHNPYNPLTRLVVKTCEVDRGANLVAAGWLHRCFLHAGLRPLSSKYILFFPAWLSVLRSLERRLGWLPLGGQYIVSALK